LKSEVGSLKSEVGSRKSEVGSLKSEVGSRKSEVGRQQKLRLLYLSPETLLSSPVWERLTPPNLKITGLILDEAHCLVQWGDSFRPAYRRLGAVRDALLQSKPPGTQIAIAAFTATADPKAQKTLETVLNLKNPAYFRISPYRGHLRLQVKQIWTPKCRKEQLLRFIKPRQQQTGLVYVRSRRESETLAQELKALRYHSAAYHAGLSSQQRRYLEESWLTGEIQFVVCSSAFGLGINKSNVRWVVHFHPPHLLAEYLQEVGRGGRDGKLSETLTLISEPTGWLDPTDKRRQNYFLERLKQQYQQAQRIAQQIPTQGSVAGVIEEFKGGELALALLQTMGRLKWLDPFHYQLKSGQSKVSIRQLNQMQQQAAAQMGQYLRTKQCRWGFILKVFGFDREAENFRCGNCDNCLK
jgi:ATP-dependent DNA helicase RecQ